MAEWFNFAVVFDTPITKETEKALIRDFKEKDYDFPEHSVTHPGTPQAYRSPLQLTDIVRIFREHNTSGRFWMYRSNSEYTIYTDSRVVHFGPNVVDPFAASRAFWERKREELLKDRVDTYLKLCMSFSVSATILNPVALGILGWTFVRNDADRAMIKNGQLYFEFPPPSTIEEFQDALRLAIGNS
jgi:hypothetical protein